MPTAPIAHLPLSLSDRQLTHIIGVAAGLPTSRRGPLLELIGAYVVTHAGDDCPSDEVVDAAIASALESIMRDPTANLIA